MASCSACAKLVCGCKFTDPVDVNATGDGIVDQFTALADAARDVWTQVGARSYKVFLVKTRWTGGERGIGQEEVVHEELILPTPRVSASTALSQQSTSIGMMESGSIEISEISLRYTEHQLLGREADGRPVPDDMSFYWEIQDIWDGPPNNTRRRYTPANVPDYDAEMLEWRISLMRQMGDRTRLGEPQ